MNKYLQAKGRLLHHGEMNKTEAGICSSTQQI